MIKFLLFNGFNIKSMYQKVSSGCLYFSAVLVMCLSFFSVSAHASTAYEMFVPLDLNPVTITYDPKNQTDGDILTTYTFTVKMEDPFSSIHIQDTMPPSSTSPDPIPFQYGVAGPGWTITSDEATRTVVFQRQFNTGSTVVTPLTFELYGRYGPNSTFAVTFDRQVPPTPQIPVPSAAWLFGSGLIGLAGAARKRKTA